MSWQEQTAWTLAFVALLAYIVVGLVREARRDDRCEMDMVTRGYEGYEQRHRCLLQRNHDAPHDFEGLRPLRSGTTVGIVHSMDVGGPLISAGQSVFRKGTRVEDRLGHPNNPRSTGCVLHYDASPGHEAAIVRWDNGMVTVELDVTTLAPVPMLSPLAGVVR